MQTVDSTVTACRNSFSYYFVFHVAYTISNKLQEAVITACTRGFNIFAKFCCRQSKLLQPSSCIFSALHCGLIASYFNHSSWGSQKLFIIRLVVAEVISTVTLYLLPASKRRNFYLVGYVQAQQFYAWTLLIDRRFDSNDVSVYCKWRGRINKKKQVKRMVSSRSISDSQSKL